MTHLGDFSVTTKKFFHIHPLPSSRQRKVLKALHFYSPTKGPAQNFKVQLLILWALKELPCSLWNDTFVPSNISVVVYAEFFINGGRTFSGTHWLSSIRSTEWKLTIPSHSKPRLLLPVVQPVVLGVVTDDWDADQENFHYFIRPKR